MIKGAHLWGNIYFLFNSSVSPLMLLSISHIFIENKFSYFPFVEVHLLLLCLPFYPSVN